MRRLKAVLVSLAGAIGAGMIALATLLHVARPDLLTMVLSGMFGSTRSATAWLYCVGILIAVLIIVSAKRPLNRSRLILGAFASVAVVLVIIHAFTSTRYYTIETVHYASVDGTPLEASLYMPRSAGPHPALVIVHGSAPMRRGAYEVLAQPVVRNGYAILLADKRGVGGSGGTFDTQDNTGTANIARLTSDVVAGVRFLATHGSIDRKRIGLFGISQAGWVAPLAARQDTLVRFLVMITSPTVSVREENVWSRLRGDHSGDAIVSLRAAEQIIDTVSSGGIDPRGTLGSLAIPGVWLFADEDGSIPSRKSIRVLDSLAAGGSRYSHILYEGYDHALFGRNGALVPRMATAWRGDVVQWLDANVMRRR